ELLKALASFPELVSHAALALEPHRIIYFLQDLAGLFHGFYSKHRVISDDAELTQARLWLVEGLRTVFRNGLVMMGMTAPESM
ncbi:MAG: arginine--tRNA ligase, partial [Chloroflexi bacterium]|nr:arginine--tRNA ligase [Chloroflexota bacterium]